MAEIVEHQRPIHLESSSLETFDAIVKPIQHVVAHSDPVVTGAGCSNSSDDLASFNIDSMEPVYGKKQPPRTTQPSGETQEIDRLL